MMGKFKGLHADSNSPYRGMTLQELVDMKRKKRMGAVDAYPQAVRELVHEYGLAVVKTIYDFGVQKPKHIRHIVETVLNEFSPTRGSYSSQGIRTEVDTHPAAANLDHVPTALTSAKSQEAGS